MAKTKILMTGAAGYIASQILPTFQAHDLVWSMSQKNRQGEKIQDIVVLDLIDPDRDKYARYFEGRGCDRASRLQTPQRPEPPGAFFRRSKTSRMACNVFRTAYDAGVGRVIMASSNHAADWYEHALIHQGAMEVLEPYMLPLYQTTSMAGPKRHTSTWAFVCLRRHGFP